MESLSNSELVMLLVDNARGRQQQDILSGSAFKAGYLEGLLVNLLHDVPGVRAEIEGRLATQLKMEKQDA